MNYILLWCIILPFVASLKRTPNMCVNCKHFIHDEHNNIYGKCAAFPIVKEIESIHYLITGIKEEEKKDYFYCSTARKSEAMCGVSGKKFEKK